MDYTERELLDNQISNLCDNVSGQYQISDSLYGGENLKRGLRNPDGTGVLVGVTKIGSVQGYYLVDGEKNPTKGKLYYRGIDVEDIVEDHRKKNIFGYEEVAYLLLLGKLPNSEQFNLFNGILTKARKFPDNFVEDMIIKAPSRNIMNKLARGVMSLYSYDDNPDDISLKNMMRQSIELISRFPGIVANAYAVKRHYYDGKSLYLHNPKENLSVSENFLRMVRKDKSYTDEEAKLLDLMMIIHAEHGGGNNSAFTCRSISSTGSDTYSAIAGAVGSLKGPLHGGANAKVMEMFDNIKSSLSSFDDDSVGSYLDKILNKEANDCSGKIYGLGHAVYTLSDPRAVILKKYAYDMAKKKDRFDDFQLMEKIENLGIERIMDKKKKNIPICANVDMYSGLVYRMLEIPDELFTPLFAISRIAGWCAHRIEEVMTGKRIIRPAYRAAVKKVPYIPMEER